MSSYNLYRGTHVSQNKRLLKDILRDEWGFDGAVISDWGAVHDTDQAIEGGLDLEFGSWTDGLSQGTPNAYDNYYLAYPYLKKIKAGEVGTEELDRKVANVLRLIFRTAMNSGKPYGSMNSPEHVAAARRIAGEGIVLLKNDRGLLPLSLTPGTRIAVIGENAIKMMTCGGGSSSLKARREVSPLEGLRERAGEGVEVVYARGYVGDPVMEQDGLKVQDISDSRSPRELMDEAVAAARGADYVVFVGGLNKRPHQDCEDADREGLGLPYGQDELLERLVDVNPNVVFVNVSGNPVAMPWVKRVPAVVQAWFIGSEAGHAIADVLSGDVNPSGKLPMTFPVRLADVAAHSVGEYPGNSGAIASMKSQGDTIPEYYHDDIFIGYRHFDKERIEPLFPFGHGLSYTTFSYGKPRLSKPELSADSDTLTVSVDVTNSGSRAGSETVQLYIADEKSRLPRPAKELKGFEKVSLLPGETKTVEFVVGRDAMSYFDDAERRWVAEPGRFQALVGASSRDIRGRAAFTLK